MTATVANKRSEKRQSRSIRTEKQLLDAAEALFAKQGYRTTKITDIVRDSGVSTGSFYHHFKDKDALAHVLVSRFVSEANQLIDDLDLSREARGDIQGMLAYLARQLCDIMNERLGVYRASQRINFMGSVGPSHTGILVPPLEAKVLAQLDDYKDQISAPDKAQALQHALQLLIMVTLQTRLGAGEMFPKDTNKLVEMLVKAAIGLLRQEEFS